MHRESSVAWPFTWVLATKDKNELMMTYANVASNLDLSIQVKSAPPFVVDPTYAPGDNHHSIWGEELGSGPYNSLTKSSRFIVNDISAVPGWTTDTEALLKILEESKIEAARSIDPTLGNYFDWMYNTYFPRADVGITRTLTVVVNS